MDRCFMEAVCRYGLQNAIHGCISLAFFVVENNMGGHSLEGSHNLNLALASMGFAPNAICASPQQGIEGEAV